jgi:hypothetical protein
MVLFDRGLPNKTGRESPSPTEVRTVTWKKSRDRRVLTRVFLLRDGGTPGAGLPLLPLAEIS